MLKLSLVLISLCFAPYPLAAQVDLQRRPAPAPEYTLGVGDQINLQVDDVEETTGGKSYTVDPAGFVDLPMAGRVEAAGLTLIQFKAELTLRLKKYITAPQVTANLVQSGSQPVSVIGSVNLPGVHQLAGSKTLLEVISLSGGLKPDAGPNVIITREPRWGGINSSKAHVDPATGYVTATFSLDDLLASKTPENNILMKPDDVVSVPRAELVYVVGDVKKAGGFMLSTHETVSLLQALSLAEGTGPDSSARHARILRQEPGSQGVPREIPVDVEKILAGKAPDVRLFANDVLFIPHSGVKVTSRRVLEAALGISSGLLIYR